MVAEPQLQQGGWIKIFLGVNVSRPFGRNQCAPTDDAAVGTILDGTMTVDQGATAETQTNIVSHGDAPAMDADSVLDPEGAATVPTPAPHGTRPRTSREPGPHFRMRLYTGQYNKERVLPVPVFGKSTRDSSGHTEENLRSV